MKRFKNHSVILVLCLLIPTLLSFTNDTTFKYLRAEKETVRKPQAPEVGNEPVLDLQHLESIIPDNIITSYDVTITMYEPVEGQTDASPNITADGTIIEINHAGRYKYVALSRNLLKQWGGEIQYGDFIELRDADDKSGIYQVRDTMHPRFINYVDILESPGTHIYKFENAKLVKPNANYKDQ